MSAERAALMNMLEATKDTVAALTGIRSQFIEHGWPAEIAEEMTLELLRHSRASMEGGRQ